MRASVSQDGGQTRKKRRVENELEKLEYVPNPKVSAWVCEGKSAVGVRLSSRITRAVSVGLGALTHTGAVVRRVALPSSSERNAAATLLAAEILARGKTAVVLMGEPNRNALQSLSTVSSLGPFGVGTSALSNRGVAVIETTSMGDGLPENVFPRDVVVVMDTAVEEETVAAVRALMPTASLFLIAPTTPAALRAPIATTTGEKNATPIAVGVASVGGEAKIRRLLRLATQPSLASVWKFATWQGAAFWAEALLAVVPAAKIVGDGESSHDDFNAAATRGETVVFVTSKNAVPKNAGAVVVVDPIAGESFAEVVEGTGRCATRPSVVVLVDRGVDENGYLAWLQTSALSRRILPTWERLPNVHAAMGGLLWKKIATQTKKLFGLHTKAFDAYRATMKKLSRATPRDIFGGFARYVDEYAAQFGLDEAPPLDLRTKDTPFRPAEDIMRSVVDARKKRKRRMKRIGEEGDDPLEARDDPLEESVN